MMAGGLGLDLNGIWDFAADEHCNAQSGPHDLGKHGSLVRLAADPVQWIGGNQAALAPHGRGPAWGPIGNAKHRLFVRDILKKLETASSSDSHATALVCLVDALADRDGSAVLAVPDVAGFDEGARDRLLRALHRSAKLNPTLLWRPIAAILGWLDPAQPRGGAEPHDDMCIAIVSLLDGGVHVATASLIREHWKGEALWVPERSGSGLELARSFAWEQGPRQIARQLAADLGMDEDQVLASVQAPWRAGILDKAPPELVRTSDGSWRKLPATACPSMTPAREDVSEAAEDALRRADAIVVEGPLVENRTWTRSVLETLGVASDRRICKAPRGLVARGCRVAALRRDAGAPVYYDFLPQLEINALVDDRPLFVELIPKNKRLLGGTVYRGEAPGKFALDRGATRPAFYLFKEDFPRGRKAEVHLPEEPTSQHRVWVSVEQSPGQGFARVRIGSDSFEALRRHPLELDWSSMEVIDQTREEVLQALAGEAGLRYPDIVPHPGHPIHWHPNHRGGNLLQQLEAYRQRPLIEGRTINRTTHAALAVLRNRFEQARNPSRVARGIGVMCKDHGNFRALDSDGSLPLARADLPVPDRTHEALNAALSKVGMELQQILASWGQQADPKLVGDIIGFASWCFWRCPEPITHFLLDVYGDRRAFPVHHAQLREGLGRVVHTPDEMKRYFAVIDAKLSSAKPLAASEFAALRRVLGGCPEAANNLPASTADRLLQETSDQLSEENTKQEKYAYKRKFKFALLMLAALLRHRERRSTFLDPESSSAAKELLNILDDALERMERFRGKAMYTANRSQSARRASHQAVARRLKSNIEIMQELIEFINMRGSDPNIIRKIEDMEE